MKPEIKAKWVAALRSGDYRQGREHLHVDGAFCCLGVLCDLYAIESGIEFGPDLKAEFDEELPSEDVCEWAGLANNDPHLKIDGKRVWVSVHNDGDNKGEIPAKTFLQIADAIEEQL